MISLSCSSVLGKASEIPGRGPRYPPRRPPACHQPSLPLGFQGQAPKGRAAPTCHCLPPLPTCASRLLTAAPKHGPPRFPPGELPAGARTPGRKVSSAAPPSFSPDLTSPRNFTPALSTTQTPPPPLHLGFGQNDLVSDVPGTCTGLPLLQPPLPTEMLASLQELNSEEPSSSRSFLAIPLGVTVNSFHIRT